MTLPKIKIELIGVNSAGKSTLQKTIARIESIDSGDRSFKSDAKIAHILLPQHQ
ncbi:MAG: hypothetical protein ACRC2R_07885 [Xenococcaceae cyanobacterium]